jgi:hypothetical protein
MIPADSIVQRCDPSEELQPLITTRRDWMMMMKLKENLLCISALAMSAQGKDLSAKFDEWKGSLGQVDDVCVTGIRV